METVKPTAIRPYDHKVAYESPRQGRLKPSKSSADLSNLSRTSSFLSFTGLESLKSGALFGIFEKGGYEPEPQTPDVVASERHDFHLSSPVTPEDPHRLKSDATLFVAKLLSVCAAAFTFIFLFNQIPSTNRFCAISPAQSTNPIIYTIAAASVSVIFPLLDQVLASSSLLHHMSIKNLIKLDASTSTTESHAPARSHRKSGRDWSFNILIRYFTGFLGLAYAGTKLDFSKSSQFNICVALVSLCANVILVRSLSGLMASLLLTVLATGTYATIVRVPEQNLVGAALLVWLNVLVYGSLGKAMRLVDWP